MGTAVRLDHARIARPVWRHLSRLAGNAALATASLLFVATLGETLLFRVVLTPSDVPRVWFHEGLVRYRPNQQGTWRVRDEIAGRFRINTQGWNSGRDRYTVARTPGRMRIAIVGDSYVEALQVDADESLAEQLERRLRPMDVEVFRFGISGAPLSHYVYMTEREVLRYRPDLLVVVIVHNDFDESFRFRPGRYTSSFLKIRVRDGRVVGDVEPQPYSEGWRDWIRQTATLRYLHFRYRVTPESIREMFLPSSRDLAYQANVDVAAVRAEMPDIEAATRDLLDRLAMLARTHGVRLLLLVDGDRHAIYAGADSEERYRDGALSLNALTARIAAERGIPLVDLHPRFAADWANHRRRFDFDADGHWNERGHSIAAAAIEEAVRRNDVADTQPQSVECRLAFGSSGSSTD